MAALFDCGRSELRDSICDVWGGWNHPARWLLSGFELIRASVGNCICGDDAGR